MKIFSLCIATLILGCGSETADSTSLNPVSSFSDFVQPPPSCEPTSSTGVIEGKVTESVQQFAIWGAEVTASSEGKVPHHTFTNQEGFYRACDLSPGIYEVSAVATGFEATVESKREDIPVRSGTATQAIDLQLSLNSQQPPGNVGAIMGRVISAAPPNEGIHEAAVEAWVDVEILNNQIVRGKRIRDTLTDENGSFFLTLDTGSYTLRISKDGFRPNPRLITGIVVHSDIVTVLPKNIELFPE